MIELSALVTICKEAVKLGAEALKKRQAANLSQEEKDLLIAASSNGEFHVITGERIPSAVIRAGGLDFPKIIEPAACAKYVGAFRELCRRHYVEHDSGVLFNLTAAGFARAEDIE
jgi:hypothetical protein